MSTVRAWAVIVAAMLLAPTALASAPFTARSLLFTGTSTISADASALFYVLQEEGDLVEWEIVADAATLHREYLVEIVVDNPLNPATYLYNKEMDSGDETIDLGAIAISSRGAGGADGGAFLARGDASSSATSPGHVRVRSVSSPTVSQSGTADVRTSEDANTGIQETLPGDLLQMSISDGTVTLRGDLVLDLFGPHYAILSGGEETEYRTGEFETQRAGGVAEAHIEYHQIMLTNAVLQLRAFQPIELFATYPTLDIAGTLEASEAQGELSSDLRETGGSVWRGTTSLSLAPSAGLVTVATPDAVVTTGAILAQPSVPYTFGAVAALALIGALGIALLLRRQREDDLELALLAMEERRWQDALPRLTRVAKRQPTNAGVLIDRALCLEQVGRFEEAAKAFEAALRAAPKHAEAHFYYARTLAKMQEKEAARVHLETALERDPRLVEMMRAESVLKGL